MSDVTLGAPSPKFRSPALGLRRVLTHLVIFAVFIGIWETAARLGLVNSLILPAPSAVAAAVWDLYLVSGDVYRHFFVTLMEALAGFAIGATIGVALATAAALNRKFRRYASPYVVFFDVTPGIAVTPIFIAWFGFGWSSKIAIAALVCFFPPFVNTLTGLLSFDRDAGEMFRSLSANPRQVFWKLMIPSALPYIMAGLKTAMALALIGAIVGEFVSASEGIGILMQRYSFKLDMDYSIASLLSMSLMGLLLFTVMEILDRRTIFWKSDARLNAMSKRQARRWREKEKRIGS
jgi:NitT/TauT family transport system permease protein